jgi:hypothetical protein
VILSSQHKEEVRVDNRDMLLLPDVCTYKTKVIRVEVGGQRRRGKSNKGST